MPELQLGLTEYFEFYNTERPHQSLGNLTPIQVYQAGSGGGARIVDKFKEELRNQIANEAAVEQNQRTRKQGKSNKIRQLKRKKRRAKT